MENDINSGRSQGDEEHEEDNTNELVTIFSTESQGVAAVVKSILDEAGISYNVTGEGIQSMFGVGVLGPGGFSPLTEPIEFQVIEKDVNEALDLLKDVEKSEPLDESGAPSENDSGMIGGEEIDDND